MSENNAYMSPEDSPGEVSPKTGIRRVNNIPLYILFGVLGAFILIMMMVAIDRAEQQHAPNEKPQERAGSTKMFADEIAGTQTAGFIPPSEPPVIPNLAQQIKQPTVITQTTPDPITSPVPPVLTPPTPPARTALQTQRDDEARRIRTMKLQMLERAITASPKVQTLMPSQPISTPASINRHPKTRQEMIDEIARVRQQIASNHRSTDPTAAYKARLAQIEGISNTGTGSNATTRIQPIADPNNYSRSNNNAPDRWRLNTQVQAPQSPYALRAGFVIPAMLISGINSDLPGQIVAQVSQNVTDTATGIHLLIPQGARLIGTYSNEIAYGQQRILITWNRIIFPDGKALDIGAMPGADAAGYSGFHDQTHNHYLRIFGSAFLISGITASITLTQSDSSNNANESMRQRAGDALSQALGQQLGQVAIEMIRQNMNIAPTLEIRPGYRFNVIVTKDMTFTKPYQPFDYAVARP